MGGILSTETVYIMALNKREIKLVVGTATVTTLLVSLFYERHTLVDRYREWATKAKGRALSSSQIV